MELIAKIIKFFGIKSYYSTGIDGKTTCGYCGPDENGYFKYPLETDK